jgi:ATP-binding cassette subfamily B protein
MLAKPLDLESLAWPVNRLAEAIEMAAQRNGLAAGAATNPPESGAPGLADTWNEASLETWVDAAATRLGIEAEPMTSSFRDVEGMIRQAAPAILRLPDEGEGSRPRFLVLLSGGSRPALLGTDLKVYHPPLAAVRDALCLPLIAPWMTLTDQLMARAGIPPARRERARLALLEERWSAAQISAGWLLRISPGASLWQQIRLGHLANPLLVLLAAYLVQEGLLVFSWWFIGRGVFQGQFELAWLWAWALVLLTAIPFQLLVSWCQSRFSVGIGALFKQRLLVGALKMQPDEMRHQGMGQFLGRVMESEAVELLALGGGLLALVSVVQLGVAAWVLALGGAGLAQVGMLALWVAATLLAGWLAYRRGREWIESYRGMTNNLVERMVGHRTRLAQEAPGQWHAAEDQELARYLETSLHFDRSDIYLAALPGSWLVVGLAGMLPALVAVPGDLAKLAISLGGVMLAYQAFQTIELGVHSLVQMSLAWQQVKPLFAAAARPVDVPVVTLTQPPVTRPANAAETPDERKPLLVAKNLNFRYRERGRLVLQDCDLQIRPGDRLLMEGPSGGGKTTLAAILAGLRQPESGMLLLHGYDWQSLGSTAWRRHVVIAPQFHENHIFSETFAFNLLMGRRWPPGPKDLEEAESICKELGLGDLLAHMPSGWQQMVGENGWQLSHGERSRVFIARALLQQADLIIMDESFGALDPENLFRALDCTRRRAATLLVIAHP